MHLLQSLVALAYSVVLTAAAPATVVKLPAGVTAPENAFIAKFTNGMAQPLFDQTLGLVRTALGANHGISSTYNFDDFRGIAFDATPDLVQTLSQIPGIEYIHPDYDTQVPAQSNVAARQDPTGYALDQISHRNDSYLTGRNPPIYEAVRPLGEYMTIYVIDSGIRASHVDFEDRVAFGANYAPRNIKPGNRPGSTADLCGHGTPVAAAAAGSRYGVASNANLVDVRIFNDNCSTTTSAAIKAFEYVVHTTKSNYGTSNSVINYSVGGPDTGSFSALKDAVRSAINSGLFVAISAGNARVPAETYEPANVAEACTVGGTDAQDREYYNTNYGSAVDLFAPGADILLPAATGDQDYASKYGTSFSSPMVAGLAALYKSYGYQYVQYAPQALCDYFASHGTRDHIKFTSIPNGDYPGPNVIIYNDSGF